MQSYSTSRGPIEILRDMEAQTLCKKQGKKHVFVRAGEPHNLFYDGGVKGALRVQDMICKKCGWIHFREALEIVK